MRLVTFIGKASYPRSECVRSSGPPSHDRPLIYIKKGAGISSQGIYQLRPDHGKQCTIEHPTILEVDGENIP
jgi:hypothetical protein